MGLFYFWSIKEHEVLNLRLENYLLFSRGCSRSNCLWRPLFIAKLLMGDKLTIFVTICGLLYSHRLILPTQLDPLLIPLIFVHNSVLSSNCGIFIALAEAKCLMAAICWRTSRLNLLLAFIRKLVASWWRVLHLRAAILRELLCLWRGVVTIWILRLLLHIMKRI